MPGYGGTISPAPRPSPRPRPGPSPLARGCLRTAAVGFVLVALVAAWLWFWPTPASIERRWRAQAGFDPLVVYPHREANAAARRIEELAAPLGIAIAPDDAQQRARPSEEAVTRFAATQEALKEHLYGLRRPAPALVAPPPEVASLLAEVEPVLAEVVVLLGDAEPPRWELELDRGLDITLPNLLGHLALHRLLVATAAEAARRGEGDQARQRLDASWRLREGLSAAPLILAQLVAHLELGNDLALLRAFEGELPGWRQRLEPPPLREQTATALRLESWMFVRGLRTGRLESEIVEGRVARFLFGPFARHGVAEYVDFIEHALARLQTEDLRSFDNDRFFEEEESRIPRWNLVARLVVPNFLDSWVKAARVELDLELTRRVVEVRELVRARDAATLESLRGEHPSVVDGIRWHYRIEPDEVAIEASDDLPLELKHPLPLEIRLRRPTTDPWR